MTTFDEREHAFEAKFAHDAEMQFKAEARRNKLLGQWAAKLLGKTGVDVQTYAASIVSTNLEEPGDEDIFRKLASDLDGHVNHDDLRAKMSKLMAAAKIEIMNEL
ncbi:DUF1476 domain-containing protein [Amylibacter sp. SFDW26]|uniref:DUF1476 domain-containing protein n=1 Tax=Amylibacter sp. SFDW26 TaxID=2652722 RepID=UPI0012625E81|nr:DUF1476 domain-containing protein [Amylibacter sp. SFDW26]KAB7615872.1 DUF1476 domain-containing protein [Amylibacter sp. SFDW26]